MTLGDHNSTSRSGFSLIEALVVLAIGGMALAIIFSIGTKAGETGFGLGRRAMAASESDVAASDLRTVIRSIALRPSATILSGVDRPTTGDARKLESDVVMERATQCAPEGWAGRLTLEVEPRGGGSALVCSAGDRKATLVVTPGKGAALSYSTDGVEWSPVFSNARSSQAAFEQPRSEIVWVRFAAPPVIDVVESASSGRPEAWARIDVE